MDNRFLNTVSLTNVFWKTAFEGNENKNEKKKKKKNE